MVLKAQSILSWGGRQPKCCSLCQYIFDEGTSFVDGRTRTGQWGILCIRCHAQDGIGLGLGKGQMYDWATKKKLTEEKPAQ